ncbi:MAG: metallo-beta-lactamase family protein [Pseudonocardia sp.]|jgi:beta-lactamase superfamily II metal-dependent hydrolase|nr:metallo-beta-lactamase family protein [Pseudonocardia sp.]
MAVFSLEALDAKSGDALLVHYGTSQDPRILVVDGGFASTYDERLKPRLDELRLARGLTSSEPLPVDHVMVSHLDLDHISGVVRMFGELRDAANSGGALPYGIGRLWHNSFDDSLREIVRSASLPAGLVDATHSSEVVAASVADARALRDIAEMFALQGNPPFKGLVLAPRQVELGNGLHASVVGPDPDRLAALQKQWQKDIKKRVRDGDTARVAAYVDNSVPNLSSIAVLLRQGTRTMLLTGDARGDDTLRGLAAANLIDANGKCKVDVLKLPHHGSDRNIDRDYFETIIADHYVISADGRHDNPSRATLQALTASQGDRRYTVYLTNPAGAAILKADLAAHKRNYTVEVRPTTKASIVVNLEDPAP